MFSKFISLFRVTRSLCVYQLELNGEFVQINHNNSAMIEVPLIVTLENIVFFVDPFMWYITLLTCENCVNQIQWPWSFHVGIQKGQHKNVLFPWIPLGILTAYTVLNYECETVITSVNSTIAWMREGTGRQREWEEKLTICNRLRWFSSRWLMAEIYFQLHACIIYRGITVIKSYFSFIS